VAGSVVMTARDGCFVELFRSDMAARLPSPRGPMSTREYPPALS
jgi:hypothetical protein